jgi:hypothetical protein
MQVFTHDYGSRRFDMTILLQAFEWIVTITGILALLMLVVKVSQKEDTPLVQMMGSVNTVIIRIGAVCALLYLLCLHYQTTHGLLSIQSIGFYVAIGSILLTIVQGWGLKAELIESVGTVVAHKAKGVQDRMSKMAEDAKRSSDQWFYTQEKERRGPVSIDQLKQMLASGQLKSATMLWKKGMASWTPASQIQEAFLPIATDEPPPLPKEAEPPPVPA